MCGCDTSLLHFYTVLMMVIPGLLALSFSCLWRNAGTLQCKAGSTYQFYCLCLQFGDLQGILGIFILMFSSLFSWCLFPASPSDPGVGQLGNTALAWHNGKLLALMEGGYPFLMRLCAGALKSISEFTFGGDLEHNFTAHPKVDAKSGEMLSFAYR